MNLKYLFVLCFSALLLHENAQQHNKYISTIRLSQTAQNSLCLLPQNLEKMHCVLKVWPLENLLG